MYFPQSCWTEHFVTYFIFCLRNQEINSSNSAVPIGVTSSKKLCMSAILRTNPSAVMVLVSRTLAVGALSLVTMLMTTMTQFLQHLLLVGGGCDRRRFPLPNQRSFMLSASAASGRPHCEEPSAAVHPSGAAACHSLRAAGRDPIYVMKVAVSQLSAPHADCHLSLRLQPQAGMREAGQREDRDPAPLRDGE